MTLPNCMVVMEAGTGDEDQDREWTNWPFGCVNNGGQPGTLSVLLGRVNAEAA